jgi:adenine phosphoribosyltransferase
VPIRKKGKLPAETIREEYALEYGRDTIEIHKDAISKGERILLHDDLLATGGTIAAAIKLVERLGGTIVEIAFLIELLFLNGRRNLGRENIFSIVKVEKE